jgi:TetR/AcrR family transcriptional regulator
MLNNVAEEKILDAAMDVVAEYTISKTRMHLIAERSGMVQSNVHYYFKTKKDLLLSLLNMLQEIFTNERKHITMDSSDTLNAQLGEFFEQKKHIIREEPKYDRVQIDYWSLGQIDTEINDSFIQFYNIWRNHMIQVMDKHMPEMDISKKSIVASIMISMMMGASLQYLNNKEAFDLDQYFDLCLEMIINVLQ